MPRRAGVENKPIVETTDAEKVSEVTSRLLAIVDEFGARALDRAYNGLPGVLKHQRSVETLDKHKTIQERILEHTEHHGYFSPWGIEVFSREFDVSDAQVRRAIEELVQDNKLQYDTNSLMGYKKPAPTGKYRHMTWHHRPEELGFLTRELQPTAEAE